MDQAISDHTPSVDELRRAAAIWAIVLDALAKGAARQKLLTPELAELLAHVSSDYPSLYRNCSSAGVSSHALIQSSADFVCGNSCAPSAGLFKDTAGKIFEKALGKTLDKAFEGTKAVEDGIAIADDLEQIADGGGTYAEGLVNLAFSKDPVEFVGAVGQLIKGTSEIIAASGNPAAASVVAVISAFEIGWELGSAANLVIDCAQWKGDNCCDPGEEPRCSGACCASTEWCSEGLCCDLGDVACDGACVNGTSDDEHCGASSTLPCGVACLSGTECLGGVCTEVVDAGADGSVDAANDSAGDAGQQDAACDTECLQGESCASCGGVSGCVPEGTPCCDQSGDGGVNSSCSCGASLCNVTTPPWCNSPWVLTTPVPTCANGICGEMLMETQCSLQSTPIICLDETNMLYGMGVCDAVAAACVVEWHNTTCCPTCSPSPTKCDENFKGGCAPK